MSATVSHRLDEPLACEAEPIHIPGSIQPFGMLLAIDAQQRVQHASANCEQYLNCSVEAVLGTHLADLFPRQGDELVRAVDLLEERHAARYLTTIDLEKQGRTQQMSVLAHRQPGLAILELEPLEPGEAADFPSLYPLTSDLVAKLQASRDESELHQIVAAEVRKLTRFDRVLIYQFDEDAHGTVVAEDRSSALPSYLGHRFPASDIPPQARELYRLNRLRLIADVDYRPSPITPALRPDTQAPLDLTYSVLRSVSPVHLEYMANMKTAASMSVSVLHRGRLWGLISCHHSAPRRVSFLVRATCDFIGQILSLQLTSHEHRVEHQRGVELKSVQTKLLHAMADANDLIEGMTQHPQELLDFASATGAAVVSEQRCALVGQTPSEAQVRALAEWLSSDVQEGSFHCAALAEHFPPASEYPEVASGLLAISVSKLHPSFVLWFRPEVIRTVTWAGDPHKAVEPGEGRLRPRKSFEMWRETVRQKATPFRRSEIDAAIDLRSALLGIVLRKAEEMADLSQELERSNKELEAFSYSVSHDLRAPFRHIVGYAELLRERLKDNGDAGDSDRYLNTISDAAQQAGRLIDNLLAFSRMGRQRLEIGLIDLNQLVAEIRQTMESDLVGRDIEWRIASLPTVSGDAMMLRQAVENLLSNAVKYTRQRSPAVIEVGASTTPREHVIYVKDNGIGFDMQYADKLFGVFQRLHRIEDFEGTGIGLANVRRIVARHGGRTWADAAPDRGATLFFSLPFLPT